MFIKLQIKCFLRIRHKMARSLGNRVRSNHAEHVSTNDPIIYEGWGGPVCTTFLKTHGLTPLSDAFFNADHDELIEIYIFSRNCHPRPHLC